MRVGKKRSDRRWRAPNGTVWASRFEWQVYDALKSANVSVRKCDKDDTISYVEPKRSGRCLECGSDKVVQERTYTPDLFVSETREGDASGGYYLETKGYFRPEKRKLFRDFRTSNPDYPIRFILERDSWVTKGKTKLTDYFQRYLKTVPVHVWDGSLPKDWL